MGECGCFVCASASLRLYFGEGGAFCACVSSGSLFVFVFGCVVVCLRMGLCVQGHWFCCCLF